MTAAADPGAGEGGFSTARPPFAWLLEREVLRFLKIWQFTLAGPILSALLFVLVFGFALRGHIGGVDGVPYDQFILPGLAAQAVVTVGYVNGTTSLFDARRDRYINDVLASPLRWWEMDLALAAGGAIRGLVVGSGVLLVAVPATHLHIRHPGVLAAASLLTLVAAAQLGVLAGAYARTLEHVYSIEALVVLPLGFLGGIFYSVRNLPEPWRTVSHLNPVFYVVQAVRIGLIGRADVSTGVALGVVCGFAVVLSLWSAAVFRTGRLLKP